MAIGGRGFGWGRTMYGMGMPNYGGSELSGLSSWAALSRGMTNFGNFGQRMWGVGSQIKGLYKTGVEDQAKRDQARAKINADFVAKNEKAVGTAAAELVKGLKNAANVTTDPRYKRAIERVTQQFIDASRAASTISQKLELLGKTSGKINLLASSARGNDRKLMVDLSNASVLRHEKLRQQVRQNQSHRVASLSRDSIIRFSHTVGRMFGYAAQLKHAVDASNAIFQAVNSKANQFARMQMAVTSERGGYGRQIRGAGINFGGMMAAIAAGRSAGMDDRQAIGQMVSLQTRLSQARWGEGDLIDKAGRWGISTYNRNGSVRSNEEMMVEFSRKLKSLGSSMEKLQFLTHLGFQPEQMEYVANFEREHKRMQFLKQNPHLQGVLDRANILDESGFSAKADAATKLELKRRQILNQNAVEEGLIPAITRSLHPENWFFSDWTAREKGVKQAKGEMAMERLTKAINDEIKEKGKSSNVVDNVVAKLSPEDVASLAAVMQKDIDNKGENSIYAAIQRSFESEFGMVFDTRTPIQRLQDALAPATQKIASIIEKIFNLLTKGSVGKFIRENPKTSAAVGLAGAVGLPALGLGLFSAIRHPIATAKAAKGIWGWAKGLFGKKGASAIAEGLGAEVAGAEAAGAGLSTVAGVGSAAGAGAAANAATKTVPGAIPDASGRHNLTDTPSEAREFINGNKSAGAGTAGVAGKAAKTGHVGRFLKGGFGKGSIITTAIFAIPDAWSTYKAYSEGNTRTGNRKAGELGGGIAGGLAGAKIGAGIGAFGGAPGIAIGGALGLLIGSLAGDRLGGKIGDAISNTTGAKDKPPTKEERHESAIEAGDKFIEELQELCKSTDGLKKAQEKLLAKGIHLNEGILKSHKFKTDSTFAKEAVSASYVAELLGGYASRTGSSIGEEDFRMKANSNPVIKAALEQGMNIGISDMITGASGKGAFSWGMMENYMKKGHLDPQKMARHREDVRRAHPEWSQAQIDEEAEGRAKAEFNKNLTQKDYENVKASLIEETKKNQEFQTEKEYDDMLNQTSASAVGKRIDMGDQYDDAYKAKLRFQKALLFGGGEREKNEAVLQYMEKSGIGDVENRTEGQKFEEEQIDDFEKFMQEHKGMSGAQAISEYAIARGLSKNQVRDIAYAGLSSSATFGMNAAKGLSEEARKGGKGKAAASEEARAKRKATQERDYEAAAKGASDEEISAALEDEGDVATYKRLAAKKAAGGGLTDNEKEAFKNFTTKIGQKVAMKSSRAVGRKDYEETEEDKIMAARFAKENAAPATSDTNQQRYTGMGDIQGLRQWRRISRTALRPHLRQHYKALRRGIKRSASGGGLGGARFTGDEAGVGAKFSVGKMANAEQAVSAMAAAGSGAETAAASVKNLGGGASGGNRQTVTVTIAGTTVNQTFNDASATDPSKMQDTMANVGSTIGNKYASALVMQAKDLGTPV